MRKIRWGVLGTARIAVQKVIPAMQQGRYSEISAIASRTKARAHTISHQLNIEKAYGSYDALLADPAIDAVYIPLPNHLHVPWSIKALQAGKHVLCEKPVALNADEARTLLETAAKFPDLKIMEAFVYRQHPQWPYVKRVIKTGGIGELRAIQSFYAYTNRDPDNIRNISKFGGGGLMDIGCYCISLSRYIFEREPVRVCAWMQDDPQFKTDRLTSALLDFGNGIASFTCATQLAFMQKVEIVGTEGRIELKTPFIVPLDRPSQLFFHSGESANAVGFDICNPYTVQGDIFSRAVFAGDALPVTINDAVANMKVIDAVVQSAQKGNMVKL